MNKKQVLFCTIIVLVILSNCACSRQKVESNRIEVKHDSTVVIMLQQEDFDEFHKRFFSDSLFQKSRINFPLEGMSTDFVFDLEEQEDIETDTFFVKNHVFYWKQNTFPKLYFDSDVLNLFDLRQEINDNSVVEYLKSKEEAWITTFKYELIENKWFLVYFANEYYE